MAETIALYGAGGFGRQLVAQHRRRIGLIVDDGLAGGDLLGIPIIASSALDPAMKLIVAITDPRVRREVAARLPNPPATLIAPTALVGEAAELGEGAVLCEMVQIVGFCRTGRHFHANLGSYVSHDCAIGDFVTFAPKVCCNGAVTIGDGAYLGAGAMLKQGIRIGRGAVIGMGAVVIDDVPDGAVVAGNPARTIRPG